MYQGFGNKTMDSVRKGVHVAGLKFRVRTFGNRTTHLCKLFQRGSFTNSVDPDEAPPNAASQQGMCCLLRYTSSW